MPVHETYSRAQTISTKVAGMTLLVVLLLFGVRRSLAGDDETALAAYQKRVEEKRESLRKSLEKDIADIPRRLKKADTPAEKKKFSNQLTDLKTQLKGADQLKLTVPLKLNMEVNDIGTIPEGAMWPIAIWNDTEVELRATSTTFVSRGGQLAQKNNRSETRVVVRGLETKNWKTDARREITGLFRATETAKDRDDPTKKLIVLEPYTLSAEKSGVSN